MDLLHTLYTTNSSILMFFFQQQGLFYDISIFFFDYYFYDNFFLLFQKGQQKCTFKSKPESKSLSDSLPKFTLEHSI